MLNTWWILAEKKDEKKQRKKGKKKKKERKEERKKERKKRRTTDRLCSKRSFEHVSNGFSQASLWDIGLGSQPLFMSEIRFRSPYKFYTFSLLFRSFLPFSSLKHKTHTFQRIYTYSAISLKIFSVNRKHLHLQFINCKCVLKHRAKICNKKWDDHRKWANKTSTYINKTNAILYVPLYGIYNFYTYTKLIISMVRTDFDFANDFAIHPLALSR